MAGYKVRIRGIEVSIESFEELKRLIEEFGSDSEGGEIKEENESPQISRLEDQQVQSKNLLDKALLKTFLEAERKGISSADLQRRLGANRKTLRKALIEWAQRMRLWQDNFDGIFEPHISKNRRGYRLTKHVLDVGKDILSM
jgi:hypothetical protein